jgi:hypothetical protein
MAKETYPKELYVKWCKRSSPYDGKELSPELVGSTELEHWADPYHENIVQVGIYRLEKIVKLKTTKTIVVEE